MTDIKRIAIMGAGSMGTMLGAVLADRGKTADLIDTNKDHVDALNSCGAKITGTVRLTVPVHALTPEQMEGSYDLIFLLVKQTHNKSAFESISRIIHENSVICTLQNGIPEPSVAEAFGKERTLGCAVTWAATYLRPGQVESTTSPHNWHSSMGTLDGAITERAKDVQKILSLMCPTEISSNLIGIRWSKLLVNSSFSGMSAALGCTFGDILNSEKALKCAQYIARECILVAKAKNIEMFPLAEGEDFRDLMYFDTEEERKATESIYRKLWGSAPKGKGSMLQDLENGRKSEIDYINGVVSAEGRKCGVPTPVCDRVVEIVKGIENGIYEPGMANLDKFDDF